MGGGKGGKGGSSGGGNKNKNKRQRTKSGYPGYGKMTSRDKKMSKTQTKSGTWATPGSAQADYGNGYRGWAVGKNSTNYSGGNIGNYHSPSAQAYRAKHGEKAYKNYVKSEGYAVGGGGSSTGNFLGGPLPTFAKTLESDQESFFGRLVSGIKDIGDWKGLDNQGMSLSEKLRNPFAAVGEKAGELRNTVLNAGTAIKFYRNQDVRDREADTLAKQQTEARRMRALSRYGEDSAQASWWSRPDNVKDLKDHRRMRIQTRQKSFEFSGESPTSVNTRTFAGIDWGKGIHRSAPNTVDPISRQGFSGLINRFASGNISHAYQDANVGFRETGRTNTLASLLNIPRTPASMERLTNLANLAGKYGAVKSVTDDPIGSVRRGVQGIGNLFRGTNRGRSNQLSSFTRSRGANPIVQDLGSFTPDMVNRGTAQQSISELNQLWAGQAERDEAHRAEIERIQSGQSFYQTELSNIGSDKTTYEEELARLTTQRQGYEKELESLKADKKTWDTEFQKATDWWSGFNKSVDEWLENYEVIDTPLGIYSHAGMRFPGTSHTGRSMMARRKGPPEERNDDWWEKYSKWDPEIAKVHKTRKEHQEYLSGLEKDRASINEYLATTQSNLEDLSKYYQQTWDQQQQLDLYEAQTLRDQEALSNYYDRYREQRAANELFRRTATLNYQQMIGSANRGMVRGIRSNRGMYNQFGRTRNRSSRGQFNRNASWRIQNLNV